ncbi:MAG: metallophosphoesterase, partial [Planctomycetales bacterium]|nr:metallophosphoesterase [Planctomycetales bacterium]
MGSLSSVLATAVVAASLAPAAGCRCHDYFDIRAPYELASSPPGPLAPIGPPLLLVADSQFHHLTGSAVGYRALLFDWAVSTAIRPVPLDMFSPWVLAHALATAPPGAVAIHLGDACDLSTVGEFVRFRDAMERSGLPWVFAPGNHDGYFFGNEQSDSGLTSALRAILSLFGLDAARDPDRMWEDSSLGSDGPMRKDLVVRLALASLALERAAPPGLRAALGIRSLLPSSPDEDRLRAIAQQIPPGRGEWSLPTGALLGVLPLRSVRWNVDPVHEYRSYLVQELLLPPRAGSPGPRVRLLLLDTANYDEPPVLLPLGGEKVNAGGT